MKRILLIKYGEIALKGQNKRQFINQLLKNIKYALRAYPALECSVLQGRLCITNLDVYASSFSQIIDAVRKVFGVVYITPAYETQPTPEALSAGVLELLHDQTPVTFKVEARRSDKLFPMTSPEICRYLGGVILTHLDGFKVDVHHPQLLVRVEIRTKAYLYTNDIPAHRGLPVGMSGRGAVLLSGGIDSPVAAFLMAKRGMTLSAIHFHAYPYTSQNAREKVLSLAQKISSYTMGMGVMMVSVTKIQEEIIANCDTTYLTVLLRRAMFKIAEKLCNAYHIDALITGESLGQVASQTIQSLNCTNEAVSMPILRPLIGMDKDDIVKIAKEIDTFSTSILPYEDCCTLFVPKHPQTMPKLERVLAQEAKIDLEQLIEDAVATKEYLHIE